MPEYAFSCFSVAPNKRYLQSKKKPNPKTSDSYMNIFLLFSPFADLSSVLASSLKGVLTCTACQCNSTGWDLGVVLHMRVGIARLASYGDDMLLIMKGERQPALSPAAGCSRHTFPSFCRGWGSFPRCQMAIWGGSPDVSMSSVKLFVMIL